jgi:hypothetical protein
VALPDPSFDRVRCWHTLEHVPEPVKLLTRLRDAVSEDGTISLVLPNRASLTCIIFRRYWNHLDVPRHLYHFRPDDILALAERCELSVVAIRHTASPSGLLGSIDCIVASMFGPGSRPLTSRNPLRKWTRLFTWWFARAGRADVVEYTLVRARKGGPQPI